MRQNDRPIARLPIIGALLVGIALLGGCRIHWLDAFGTNNSHGTSDNTGAVDTTAPVDQTDITGFDVASSSAGVDTTYDDLFNAVSGETDNVQQVDFQTDTNGATDTTTTNNTDSSSSPSDTTTDTGTTTDINSDTDTGVDTSTDTGTDMATDSAADAGIDTNVSADTDTSTDVNTDTPLDTNTSNGVDTTASTADSEPDTTVERSDSLRPTRLIIFDNPARTVPILQADARAALDLPPRLLVYRDADDNTGVAYNDTSYLAARYDLGDAEDALAAMADNLATLAQDASGNGVARQDSSTAISAGQGIVAEKSNDDFATTLSRLVSAIDDRAELRVVTQIDFQAAAHSVGLSLNPDVLVIFTDRPGDTPLIASAQTAAIDLPEKILVTEDDQGQVHVDYNDPNYIAERHHASGVGDSLETLTNRLRALVAAATDS